MQRQSITLAALAERRNLELATWKAARGKGVHSAVAAVQQSLRAYPWFAQVDARRLKGGPFKRLLAPILACGATKGAGVGRPIGALTARDFVDAFLDSADRLLLVRRLG